MSKNQAEIRNVPRYVIRDNRGKLVAITADGASEQEADALVSAMKGKFPEWDFHWHNRDSGMGDQQLFLNGELLCKGLDYASMEVMRQVVEENGERITRAIAEKRTEMGIALRRVDTALGGD